MGLNCCSLSISAVSCRPSFCISCRPSFCISCRPSFCTSCRSSFCISCRSSFCTSCRSSFCISCRSSFCTSCRSSFCTSCRSSFCISCRSSFCTSCRSSFCKFIRQKCIVRKRPCLCKLQDNLVALEKTNQKLIERRHHVMKSVINAEQQQMKRLDTVHAWLLRVDDVETRVKKLLRERSQQVHKLCLGGFCPWNCWSGCKFGKQVDKLLQDVVALTNEGDFKEVTEKMPESKVGLQSMVDKVWSCLQEEQVGTIGLYGPGGVGKTTLLIEIANKFLRRRTDFDVVIWVEGSKNLQVGKIQEYIRKRLGLSDRSWKNKNVTEKATDIFKALNGKKFALLIDDLWEQVDLREVGVPLPSPGNASKVIFTAREMKICSLMEAHQTFKVECLSDQEAWELFQSKVGKETLDSHSDVPQLARKVAEECGGLPLTLITIGRAMASKKEPKDWKYAIQVLRRSNSEFPGMEKIYTRVKFSYDSLPNDMIKSCLLYCSLFPEDYGVLKRDLIDYWIGEGFVNESTRDESLNKGYYIIGFLLHTCLLQEEKEDSSRVKIHDVVRDMSLRIACELEKEKENFLVHAGAGLSSIPDISKWEDMTRISYMNNQITATPGGNPKCPHLETLFLNNNSILMLNNFLFVDKPNLRVLNLSYNHSLKRLPEKCFSNLFILQHLDLSATGIEILPEDLKALVNLKYLNLDRTYFLRKIPRETFSCLLMLQVLRLFKCGYLCEAQEDSILFGGGESLVEEMSRLKDLYELSITLKSFHSLQKFLSSNELQKCTESLCLQDLDDSSESLNVSSLVQIEHLETLHILKCKHLEEMKIDVTGEVQNLRETHFQSLHVVKIKFCQKLKDLTWLILAPNLKIVSVSNCFDMEEVISVEKSSQVSGTIENLNVFENLESLRLKNLPNLKSICMNSLPFLRMKEMIVLGCPNVKKLPLDSNSGKARKIVIKGEEEWWKELQWDRAIEDAFLSCFISH